MNYRSGIHYIPLPNEEVILATGTELVSNQQVIIKGQVFEVGEVALAVAATKTNDDDDQLGCLGYPIAGVAILIGMGIIRLIWTPGDVVGGLLLFAVWFIAFALIMKQLEKFLRKRGNPGGHYLRLYFHDKQYKDFYFEGVDIGYAPRLAAAINQVVNKPQA